MWEDTDGWVAVANAKTLHFIPPTERSPAVYVDLDGIADRLVEIAGEIRTPLRRPIFTVGDLVRRVAGPKEFAGPALNAVGVIREIVEDGYVVEWESVPRATSWTTGIRRPGTGYRVSAKDIAPA